MENAITERNVRPWAEEEAVEKSLLAKIEGIQIVHVVDAESFEMASQNVKLMSESEKAWTGYWANIKEGAHRVWKAVVAKEKGPLDLLAKKKEAQRADAKAWADEEERKRLKAESEANEKARKAAEDEALRIAADLEAQGDKEGAAAVIDAPPPVAQAVVPKTVPAGHGGMIQKYYSASVYDIKALARAVLAGTVPVQAIQGNEVFLNAQARMLKDTMNWPGVKVNVR